MAKLNKAQQYSLTQSSVQSVINVFQRIRAYLTNAQWLDPGNAYAKDCVKALFDHTQPGQAINQNDLSEYIAASAPLHCVDGWGLLGRALDANARGDSSTAVHLGYYAELRAAMSLLAAAGIGIFEDRHFIITKSGKCRPLGRLGPKGGSNLKTHKVAWYALEYWAGLRPSADLLRKIITPGGIPLGEWVDGFGVGSMSRSIGRKWLKTWGLDLKNLSEGKDRDARNRSSYRPTNLNNKASLNALECSNFMLGLWIFFEPSSYSRFDALDRHLLRIILRQTHNALPKKSRQRFEDQISKMLKTLAIGKPLAEKWVENWKAFLIGSTDPDEPIFIREASQEDPWDHPNHHLQVISRATLMLRVATGACDQLIHKNLIRSSSHSILKFWWKPLGEERGLWEHMNEPTDLTELWGDISAALDDVRAWEAKNTGSGVSYAKWRHDLSRQISVLGECERIALWGLGL